MLFPKKKLQSNFVKLTPDSNKYTKNEKYIHNKKMLLETFRLTHSKIINSDNKLDLYKKAMSIQRKPSKKPKVLLVQNKHKVLYTNRLKEGLPPYSPIPSPYRGSEALTVTVCRAFSEIFRYIFRKTY